MELGGGLMDVETGGVSGLEDKLAADVFWGGVR